MLYAQIATIKVDSQTIQNTLRERFVRHLWQENNHVRKVRTIINPIWMSVYNSIF